MITPVIGIASGALLLMAVAGISSRYIALLYAGSIALALTVASIPIWNPMRDSGKFLANAVLAQILLMASAYAALRQSMLKKIYIYIVLACTTVIAVTTIIALQQSITPSEYPTSWYEWNTIFAQKNETPTVLFLPWHQYLPLDFTQRQAVANPAPIFFTNADVISGDNIEIMREGVVVDSISTNPRSKAIEAVLAATSDNQFESRLIDLLQNEQITHIMLAEPSNNSELARKVSRVSSLTLVSTHNDLAVWEVVSNENR